MKAKQLSKQFLRLDKEATRLETEATRDASILPLAKEARELTQAAYELLRRKREEEAIIADKGQVLWTMFQPIHCSSGRTCGVREVVRTPNRTLTAFRWPGEENPPKHSTEVHTYCNHPYKDLVKEWGKLV